MYVAMVKVGKVERSASWVVCWTMRVNEGDKDINDYHVRLWGSETVARTHAREITTLGRAAHIVVIPVTEGLHDHVWINPKLVGVATVSELSAGWYYQSCYATLIGDEVRKVCDQTQDDVHTEATARP